MHTSLFTFTQRARCWAQQYQFRLCIATASVFVAESRVWSLGAGNQDSLSKNLPSVTYKRLLSGLFSTFHSLPNKIYYYLLLHLVRPQFFFPCYQLIEDCWTKWLVLLNLTRQIEGTGWNTAGKDHLCRGMFCKGLSHVCVLPPMTQKLLFNLSGGWALTFSWKCTNRTQVISSGQVWVTNSSLWPNCLEGIDLFQCLKVKLFETLLLLHIAPP